MMYVTVELVEKLIKVMGEIKCEEVEEQDHKKEWQEAEEQDKHQEKWQEVEENFKQVDMDIGQQIQVEHLHGKLIERILLVVGDLPVSIQI